MQTSDFVNCSVFEYFESETIKGVIQTKQTERFGNMNNCEWYQYTKYAV